MTLTLYKFLYLNKVQLLINDYFVFKFLRKLMCQTVPTSYRQYVNNFVSYKTEVTVV